MRSVAKAASKFCGESLNSNLPTGPDLLQNLVGILLRFRDHPAAVFSDIKGMFMINALTQDDQSAVRFLSMIENNIQQLRFTTLIFGATLSPFWAIYVLQKCAEDNKIQNPATLNAIKHLFYMNDCIHPISANNSGSQKLHFTKKRLPEKSGFRLTNFVSHTPEVLVEILDGDKDETKEIMRVLGQKRTQHFVMFPLQQFPKYAAVYTQRKLFSLVSSIFNPLGLLFPLTVRIKMILQQIWKHENKWDELMPLELHNALRKVLNSYFAKPEFRMPRTVHNLSRNPANQLHILVDASMLAMAAFSYLRTTNSQNGQQQASFLIGKRKVVLIKQISVPKMEI